jgi:hypothetical protein
MPDAPLEAQRRTLWGSSRKPPATLPRRTFAAARAVIEDRPVRRAKGGLGR